MLLSALDLHFWNFKFLLLPLRKEVVTVVERSLSKYLRTIVVVGGNVTMFKITASSSSPFKMLPYIKSIEIRYFSQKT